MLESMDSLVLNNFIKKFNEMYSGKLLAEQKQLLFKFINHSDEDIQLKLFLNEELDRLKKEIRESLNADFLKNNTEALQKTKNLQSLLESFKVDTINEELIKKVMYIQEFVAEVKK